MVDAAVVILCRHMFPLMSENECFSTHSTVTVVQLLELTITSVPEKLRKLEVDKE